MIHLLRAKSAFDYVAEVTESSDNQVSMNIDDETENEENTQMYILALGGILLVVVSIVLFIRARKTVKMKDTVSDSDSLNPSN